MLSTRLVSLETKLQGHRCWLTAFLNRSQTSRLPTARTRPPPYPRHHSSQRNFCHAARLSAHSHAPFKSFNADKFNIRKHGKRSRSPAAPAEPDLPKANPIVEDLRKQLKDHNIKNVIEDYNALNERDKGELDKRDVRTLAQSLHYIVRREKNSAVNQHRTSEVRSFVELAEVLVKDVKGGLLVPSGKAFVHLLGIFKESGSREQGVRFWKWLREQGESYVDVDCYGSAIELLAVEGTPLAELEQIYEEGLTRFPGNFAAYHLSPNAIVPDREQPFTVGGIPITLLQGILTARLLCGDTRNAHLALDTAIRLLPDQVPHRLFWLFLEERPLQEAYTVFAVACRGGNKITPPYYRSMLGALRSGSALESPAQHALAVRAMLSVTHMYIGAGGEVAGNSVNELTIAATQFLRVKGVEALAANDKQKIVDAVMEVIRGIFEIFARYGAKPSIPAFNSIITNLGGFGNSQQTIGMALKDADAFGLAPTGVTWRSILSVAGMFQNKALVEKTFSHLRDSRIENEQNPTDSDFHALVKPAHLSGAVDFALEELDKFRDVLNANAYETIVARLEDPGEAEVRSAENITPVDVEELLTEVAKVKADIEVIKARTEGSPTVLNFHTHPLPLYLQPLDTSLDLPEPQMLALYDEFTTDPTAAPAALGTTKLGYANSVSKTDIPVGKLRYENWKVLNCLLEMAEGNDRAYAEAVDEAIAKGKVPPKRTKGVLGNGEVVESRGLSDVAGIEGTAEQGKGQAATVEQDGKDREKKSWRDEILGVGAKDAGEMSEKEQEKLKHVRDEILRLRGKK